MQRIVNFVFVIVWLQHVKCDLSYKRGHNFSFFTTEKTNTGSMRPYQLTAEYRFLQQPFIIWGRPRIEILHAAQGTANENETTVWTVPSIFKRR